MLQLPNHCHLWTCHSSQTSGLYLISYMFPIAMNPCKSRYYLLLKKPDRPRSIDSLRRICLVQRALKPLHYGQSNAIESLPSVKPPHRVIANGLTCLFGLRLQNHEFVENSMLQCLWRKKYHFRSYVGACSRADRAINGQVKPSTRLSLRIKPPLPVTVEHLACQIRCPSLIGIAAHLLPVGIMNHQSV